MSEDQAVRSSKPGRSFFRINVRTMMILVATSSLVIWSARRVWEDSTQSPYIRVLQFGNTADRRDAARQLIATPRPGEAQKVVGALIRGLHDEDVEVRTAAANSLGSVVRQLLDRWRDGPHELRTNQPLVSTTTRELAGLLKDSSDAVKSDVLRALVAIHWHAIPRTNALPELLCLGIDPSDEALTRDLRTALVKTLSDQSPGVRGLGAWALGNLGPFLSRDIPPELLDAMNDTAQDVRKNAAFACASYKEGLSPLLPDLFARLERAQPPFRHDLRLCLECGKADFSCVPMLRERLRSPSPDVRYCAARMLDGMGPQAVAATPELLAVLDEPFTEERPRRTPPDDQPDPARYAMWALSNFPPTPQFIDALTKNLRSDVLDRRFNAANHLGKLGPAARTAVPALIAMLQAQLSSSQRDVWAVEDALGRIAPGTEFADPSIAVLVEALRSKNADTRRQAAEALGRFGPEAKGAIPTLQTLTKDPAVGSRFNGDVGQAARRALLAIEPPSVPSDASPR